MCFFKHLKPVPDISAIFEKETFEQITEGLSPQKQDIQLPNFPANITCFFEGAYSSRLGDLLSRIQANNSFIGTMEQKIKSEQLCDNNAQPDRELMEDVQPVRISKDETLNKLFSDLPYNFSQNVFKYKLSLACSLPTKMYKHRKYGIGIKLMPSSARTAKIMLNSNPLTVCVGVFDKDGNWVSENAAGQPILEGLTQVNLYQGKAQFPRLLFNEISSNLPKQKLNLAIYVKPGLHNMGCGSDFSSNFMDWKSVKPLILRNVIVLSKKRKRNSEDLS